jgi:hypothetical protein
MTQISIHDVHGTDLHPDHSRGALGKVNRIIHAVDARAPLFPIFDGSRILGFAAATDPRHCIHTGTASATTAYLDITEQVAGRLIESIELVYTVAVNPIDAFAMSVVRVELSGDGTAPVESNLVAAADINIRAPDDATSLAAVATNKRKTWDVADHSPVDTSDENVESRVYLKIVLTLSDPGDSVTIKGVRLGLVAPTVDGL